MRAKVAVWLAKLAVRVLEGPDDRVVLLNIHRHRSKPGTPDAGRIHAFITLKDAPRTAVAFAPDEVPRGLGLPISHLVARWAGYEVESL